MIKTLFIGGDIRQKIAAEYLRNKNYICEDYIDTLPKNLNITEFNNIILPLPTTRDDIHIFSPLLNEKIPIKKITDNLNENQLLITGNYIPKHENFIDINKDEEFTFLNAIPTAEGAIKILIEATDFTLWKSKILIVGNGKIGKILANRLSSFCADITVSARKNLDLIFLEAFGYKILNSNCLNGKINEFDIIINTVPFPLINEELIKETKDDCLFLELSSAPFGIDKKAVVLYERNYIYAPALPGKTAPKTAGVFLGKTIEKILKETFGSDFNQ